MSVLNQWKLIAARQTYCTWSIGKTLTHHILWSIQLLDVGLTVSSLLEHVLWSVNWHLCSFSLRLSLVQNNNSNNFTRCQWRHVLFQMRSWWLQLSTHKTTQVVQTSVKETAVRTSLNECCAGLVMCSPREHVSALRQRFPMSCFVRTTVPNPKLFSSQWWDTEWTR